MAGRAIESLDILGIGNAILDVQARAEDADLPIGVRAPVMQVIRKAMRWSGTIDDALVVILRVELSL